MKFFTDSIMTNFLKDKKDIKELKISSCVAELKEITKSQYETTEFNFKTKKDMTVNDVFLFQAIKHNTTVITIELFLEFWKVEKLNNPTDVTIAINKNKHKCLPGDISTLKGDNLSLLYKNNIPIKYRDNIINEIIITLQKPYRSGVNLIGEPGSGKTSIISELAMRINDNQYSSLKDYTLMQLDANNLLGNNPNEIEYIYNVIKYAVNNKCILIVENVNETISHLGQDNSSRYIKMINMFVERGLIKAINTSHESEFILLAKENPNSTRYFETIKVPVLKKSEIINILNNRIESLQTQYNIKISDKKEFVESLYKLSNLYIKNEVNPSTSISILEKIYSVKTNEVELIKSTDEYKETVFDLMKNEKTEELNAYINNHSITIVQEDIVTIISTKINMPLHILDEDSAKSIEHVEKELYKLVKGQDKNLKSLMRSVKRYKTNIKDPNKPQVVMMLGPTGVGKTYTTKILAESLFGEDSGKFIRLDMNNYSNTMYATNLFGTSRGYVDTNKGGVLSEGVRKNPQSIVLLDEFEKANSKIINSFLQIFDEGQLVDGRGHMVDYRQCIFILTSNAGMKKVYKELNESAMGFKKTKITINDKYQKIAKKELKELFPDEIIGRIDQFLYYNYLTTDDITKIFDLEINKMAKHINKEIKIDDKLKAKVIKEHFDERYGARSLKTGIDAVIYDKIADILIKNKDKNKLYID